MTVTVDGGNLPAASHARRAGGITVFEAVLTLAMLMFVIQVVLGSTVMMTRSGTFGEKRIQLQMRADLALRKLAFEIRNSSSDTDPVTGEPYLAIDGEGGAQTLTLQRVVDFADVGELVPIWSTPIEYLVRDSDLVRRQDGAERVVLRGVTALSFEQDEIGRIKMTVAVRARQDSTAEFVDLQTLTATPSY